MNEKSGYVLEHNFCRICGAPLYHDSRFCSKCGAPVFQTEQTDASDSQIGGVAELTHLSVQVAAEPVQTAPALSAANAASMAAAWPTPAAAVDQAPVVTSKKRRIKPILFVIMACVLVVAAVAALVVHWHIFHVEQQDINAINGCPELYNVQFAMTLEEISALVETEHEAIAPGEGVLALPDGMLYIKEDAGYEIYGHPVERVTCGFDGEYLVLVLVMFSDEEMGVDKVVELYTDIYGSPNGTVDEKELTQIAVWEGEKTNITVFEDADEDLTVVRYSISENSRYTALSFDGSPIDPCGFADENPGDENISYTYLDGLIEGFDYTVYEGEKYVKYTLYPQFGYMGVEPGRTAVSMFLDNGESEFGIMQYEFFIEPSKALDVVRRLENAISDEYGLYTYCDYTSLVRAEAKLVDLSYVEFLTGIGGGTQGIYHMQWVTDQWRVTLSLIVYPSGELYSGTVSFSN